MRSFSLITILLIGSLSSTLLAQDCNNPLLEFFDLPSLDSPESGADLPYCGNLIAGETCCSADTVAAFQDRVNGIIDGLNNQASARDLYLHQLRNNYYQRFGDILNGINDDSADALSGIREVNATLADLLQGDIDSFNQARDEANDINEQFVGALDEYQTARTNCLNTALQVHSSAWCLACDPNYANEGVNDDGTVTFSDGLCQAISDACTPYFDQGGRFNPLVRVREAYWRLLAVSRYLNDFADTNELTDFIVAQDPYSPLSTQQGVEVPEPWAGQNGSCLDLWSGDEQLKNILTIGGAGKAVDEAVDDNNEITVVEEDVVSESETPTIFVDVVVDATELATSGTRLLQNALAGDAGVWEPDLTAVGLNLDELRSNPGDILGPSDQSDEQ